MLLDTGSGTEDADKVSKYRLLATIYPLTGPKPLRSRVEQPEVLTRLIREHLSG